MRGVRAAALLASVAFMLTVSATATQESRREAQPQQPRWSQRYWRQQYQHNSQLQPQNRQLQPRNRPSQPQYNQVQPQNRPAQPQHSQFQPNNNNQFQPRYSQLQGKERQAHLQQHRNQIQQGRRTSLQQTQPQSPQQQNQPRQQQWKQRQNQRQYRPTNKMLRNGGVIRRRVDSNRRRQNNRLLLRSGNTRMGNKRGINRKRQETLAADANGEIIQQQTAEITANRARQQETENPSSTALDHISNRNGQHKPVVAANRSPSTVRSNEQETKTNDNEDKDSGEPATVAEIAPRSRTNSSASSYGSLYRYVCPPDFLRLGNGCYYLSKEMQAWQAAHFECRERESQLAVVDTDWEDRTLRAYLNSHEMTRLNRWLGGIYDWEQEEWVWGGSGKVMAPYRGFLLDSNSPHSPRWTCVYMAPSLFYRWHYTKCTDRMHYICETRFKRVPRNA